MAKVTAEYDKRRLDLVLVLLFPEYSRTKARELLNNGSVVVNGVVEYRPNYKVGEGDEIELKNLVSAKVSHLKPTKGNVEIVYQDEDLLVVNKPGGLKVHPGTSRETDSLLNILYYQLKDSISGYGISLINRIDKDTSGLVLLAKTPKGAWHYSKQFEEERVEKHYLAVVDISWKSKYLYRSIIQRNFLAPDRLNHTQIAVTSAKKGKYAMTEFELINNKEGMALLSAIPKTGRTHQIRVHLKELGFPILGDKMYGGKPYDRLCLHCYSLSILGINRKKMLFKALPDAGFPFGVGDIE